ncbi:hypothetical protein EPUL_006671, partial [Erysiphe pulchra]
SQTIGNKSNLTNLSATSANSNSLFGAPQGPSLRGANLKQNLFGSELASNTCMMAPKFDETWGKGSPASTNAPTSTFSNYNKDEKSQQDSLSKNDLFPKDNEQSTESKNSLVFSPAQPTSATNLFGQQTSTSNMFSLKRDTSTLPKKSSPLKTFCEVIRPDSPEPTMDVSSNVEAQSLNFPTSNTATPPIFATAHSNLSAPVKSNLFGSVGKVPNIESGLSKSTAVAQSQMIVQNDISQIPRQNVTSSGVNLIATEKKNLKETSGFGFGFSNASTNQSRLRSDVNEKHSTSFLQSLAAKPTSNAEMKLSSNIFGQANLSVSSSHPSVTLLMVKKFFWDQTPDETKSFSSKPSNESSLRSTQTSFLPQNPRDTTSSEICRMSGNENTTVSTTEMESSEAPSRIGNSQEIRKRNKYAPNVLPRNPLFRDLALTSQIKDEEIAASLPEGCSEIERQQFFALYRLRALNKAMGKMFSELPVTSDPQIVLDFYMEERRIILDECPSFNRKTKRKFSHEECEYNTTNKKQKQIEVNNSEQELKKPVEEALSFTRKRKLDSDEYQESQNSDKRNKINQNETSQGLFSSDDSMLMTEKEAGSLFMPKMNPSSPLKPPIFTNTLMTATPSELMPSSAFPSYDSMTNIENNAYQKQENNSVFGENNSFKQNDPLASSNLKESSTANKFRSILDGPSHSNVLTHPTSSTSEKQDLLSDSNKLIQLTSKNSLPVNPFLSASTLSKSINEDSLSGNTFSKVTADINEERSQKKIENKHIENNTAQEVESQDYERSKPRFSLINEEQTPEIHTSKISQSFESAAEGERGRAGLSNPFSSIQPSIEEKVKFSTDSTKSKPKSFGFQNDSEKNTRATPASTTNTKKRKLTEENSNSDFAAVPDTDNESESEESEIDQKEEKEDPSYNPDLEISSAVSTPVEKTGAGLVASKRAIFSPESNASFKAPLKSSETGIVPGNNFGAKDLQKESGNEEERQELKTSRSLLDRVSYLPNNSDQSTSDEKNIKTPAKKDFSGFQFQSFQENKNPHGDQIWKPGAPIVFATSTSSQPSPSFGASIFNPIKIDSSVSENNDLKKASEIKLSQFLTNLLDKENSNQIPKPPISLVNNREVKATTEVGVESKPIFSTLFSNSVTTKSDSTNVESVFGQPNQPLSLFGQNGGSGTSSLFGNSTGPLSLFGKPNTTGTSSFPSIINTHETTRTAGSETEKIENDGPDEEALEADKDEQIDLTSTGPGEENEEVIHEVRVRALKFVQIKSKGSKDWEVKGVGSLRILKHKENDNCRLLLRSDPSGKIILNRAILGNVVYKSTGKTLKFLSASETGKGLETWVLQVKTE